ncbi:4-hydroxyphenylacetate decarboxylase subunit B [Syntrophobotulus glycolicus DSM 8271]|uniref:4-hydroxyphenylacetate decarboxylase subunit B n=1 Tax=Syntrophobotulus glycolicus (strain DSM 8271 / FlGlyR) TaxID=645991 RepID=F0SW35_SYNGF|nr:4-hydroxyphenylacetate decarboxylase large subunit [Syntrophobotulus glycolicus]ADY56819.1 4-hydroxyphenylacetate decarboxylase subunit B [Syntrophobotulus glycolicus DSM 8271]
MAVTAAKQIKSEAYTPEFDYTPREEKEGTGGNVKRLLGLFYQSLSSADNEFTYWYTRRWDELDGSVPVIRRAEALKSAFEHLTPTIWPGEKLALQKSKNYRGSFAMPWIQNSFLLARSNENFSGGKRVIATGGGNVTSDFGEVKSVAGKFGLRKEDFPAYRRLAQSWDGRSAEAVSRQMEEFVPDKTLKDLIQESKVSYDDAGFTIVQGRETMNLYYPFQYGLEGLVKLLEEKRDAVAGRADGDGVLGMDRFYYDQAVIIAIRGIQAWILNHAALAEKLAARESALPDEIRRRHVVEDSGESYADIYSELGKTLRKIAFDRPSTFREALQLFHALHIAASNEDPICGVSPGRLGQILYPWFEQDIEAGRITEEEVIELLEMQRIKLTTMDIFASPNTVGGNAGNTYNNLTVGGLKRDGSPAVNRLEYLFVEAGIRCSTPQPTITCLYDEKLPEDFLLQCAKCNKTGTGYPAWVNNQTSRKMLVKHFGHEGMTEEESAAAAVGGCLAIAPGVYNTIDLNGRKYEIPGGAGLTTMGGIRPFALPKMLEMTLFNGYDHNLKKQIFPPHNRVFHSYEEFLTQLKAYIDKALDVLTRFNNLYFDITRKNNMSVINSFMKPDCLKTGHHNGQKGYRYNTTFLAITSGTITFVNSLAQIKKLVFEEGKYSLEQLTDALLHNFGYDTAEESGSFSVLDRRKKDGSDQYDDIYADCLRAPKFGNADPYVDAILADYEDWFPQIVTSKETLYGEKLQVGQFVTGHHNAQGGVTLATPDGRLAGTTYTDASMSAYPGTDKNGPYAIFRSATVWDHSNTQSSMLNLKLHPTAISGDAGTKKLLALTRAYMRLGGHHIQYNIVDSNNLRDAQRHPENYRDLLVRVSGFTHYWCELSKPIQDEVISRTEYECGL